MIPFQTQKPPWHSRNKEKSLDRYAAWLNQIARGAFLEDRHHPQMFFFVTENGEIRGCQFPDGLSREQRDGIIQQQTSEIKPYGTIQIFIAEIYDPKLTSLLTSQQLQFAGSVDPDSKKLARDCLLVRMLSRTGKDKIWVNPIVRKGGRLLLTETVETYPYNE